MLRPGGSCVPLAAVPVPDVEAVPEVDALVCELPLVEAPTCAPPVWPPAVGEPFAVAPFGPVPAGVAGLISESVSTPPAPTWMIRHSDLPVMGSV
jgi:hypothetical protein